jgi:hypothetical protein
VLEREPHRRGRAHRGTGQDRLLDLHLVEHRLEVGGQVGVLVGRRVLGRSGLAVPAGVVGDHPVAAAGQELGPMDHVAAGGGEPVQQDDRRAVAELLAAERHGARIDVEGGGNRLVQRVGGCNL